MFKYANNASTTLAGQIDGNATQITVLSAAGFPALTGGDSFHVTLESPDGLVREICLVTAVGGNVFDVTRGQDGTTPQTFYVGATVAHRLVAEDLRTLYQTYLPLAGGTMTGQITLPGGGTGDQAVTYDEVAALVNGIPPPVLDGYVEKAGDTMTGALTLSGAPTQALHAATKAYADLHLPLTGGTLSGTLTLPGGGSGDQAVTFNDVSGRLIPAGGGPGFALVKASSTDYDVTWSWLDLTTPNPLPSGGATGQALVKLSNDDYDIGWGDGGGGSGLPEGANFGQMLVTLRDDNDPTQLTQYWTDFLYMPVLGEAMNGYTREVYATTGNRNSPQLALGYPTALKNPTYGRRAFLQVDIANTGIDVTLQPPNIDYKSFVVFNGTYWWEYRKIPTIDPDTGEQVWDYTDPEMPVALWDYEPQARQFTLATDIAGLNIVDAVEVAPGGGDGDWDDITLDQYEFTLGYLRYPLGNAWDYTRLGYGHVAPASGALRIPLFALRRINNWSGLNTSQVVGITESLATSTSLTTAFGFQKWLNEGPTLLHYASKRREMSRFKNIAEMFDPFYESEIYGSSPPTHLWLYPIQMELNGQVAAWDYQSGYSYLACADLDTGVWNMFFREGAWDSTADNTQITLANSELAMVLPDMTNVACVDKDNTGTYGGFGEIPTNKFALYHVIATFVDTYMTTAEGYYGSNKLFVILSEPYDSIGDAYDDAERHLNAHMNALVGNVFLSARPLASFIVDHTGLIRETPASDFQSLQDLSTGTRKQIRWIPKFGRGREYVLYDRTIEPTVVSWGVGASGATEFTQLNDVPNSYTGSGGYVVKVKSTEDGLEFAASGGGGVTDHGALTGLSDDDHSQYALADGTRGSFAAVGHDHSGVYQPADADLTALAGLTVAENALIVGNGDPAWSVLSPPTPAGDGHFLKITGLGVLEWTAWSNPPPGVEDFTDLGDVPAAYTGAGGYVVKVKSTEDGLEFAAASSGVTDHGALTGLSDDDHSQYALADGTRGAFQRYENGFPNRTDSTISFTDGTRTLSIAPASTSFTFTSNMVRYTKNSAQTVVITDTEGLHFVYFDGDGVLQSTTTFSESLILTYALVAVVYWDAANDQHLLLADERHGDSMSAVTHLFHHVTEGTRYETGLGLGDLTVGGDGSSATHVQFSVANGVIWDEDIKHTITDGSPQDLSPTAQLPIFYRSGTSTWRRIAATGYCVTTTGTGRAAYNQNVAGTWQLTEASDNSYVLSHVVATNDTEYPVVILCGQANYSGLNAAQAGAATEAQNLALGGLDALWPEWVLLATVIVQTRDNYTNTVNSRIVATADGASYIDWRVASVAGIGGISVSDHGQLGGLSDDDHTQYALADGTRGSFAAVGHDHSGVYQPADAQLTDLAGLGITKGNLIVADGTNWAALGVGTNDYVLIADSTQTLGVKWATLPSGVTDHGALTGLSDDDHTQYLLASGTRAATGLGVGVAATSGRAITIQAEYTDVNTSGVTVLSVIQPTNTASMSCFRTAPITAAASFTLSELRHFVAQTQTPGAGSAITSQYGFSCEMGAIAGSNYAFYSNLASGTNRWNLYMSGTAANYIEGSLGIGNSSVSDKKLRIAGNFPATSASYALLVDGAFLSAATSDAKGIRTGINVSAGGTVSWLTHFEAVQGTFSSTVTNQYGFAVSNTLTGATNNYGFYGNIPAGTNRWNLYMPGTAINHLAGALLIGTTSDNATDKLQVSGTAVVTSPSSGANNTQVATTAWVRTYASGAYQPLDNDLSDIAALTPTKGKLMVGDGTDWVALGVGTNDYVLTADSAQASGVKWAASGSGVTDHGALTGLSDDDHSQYLLVAGTRAATKLGIGSAPSSVTNFALSADITGGTSAWGQAVYATVQSGVTVAASGIDISLSTVAASFTLADLACYRASLGTIGAGSTVTAAYGFYGNIAAGTGRYNLYMASTAYNYLAGPLFIGEAPASQRGLVVGLAHNATGTNFGIAQTGEVQSASTGTTIGFYNVMKTQAASFTLGYYIHFYANQGTKGSGSAITDQRGFYVSDTMTGATTNYGFFGNLVAASGRWNLYMNGDAWNYLAGSLGIGQSTLTGKTLALGKTMTGSTNPVGIENVAVIQSDATVGAYGFNSQLGTAAAAFTCGVIKHFRASQDTKGSGSTITTQIGYMVESTLTGGTSNYGFYGDIASGSNRWNLYMAGTALNMLNGVTLIGTTSDNGVDKLQVSGTAVVTSPAAGANNTQVATTAWVRTYASGAYQPLDSDLTALAGLAVTKGNLIVGTGSAWAAQGVGSNSTVLIADSTQTNGVRWTSTLWLDSLRIANHVWFDEVVDNGNSGTADTIDWTVGNKQKSTLTGNCTFTFTAPNGPTDLRLGLIQDGTGGRAVTWPATVKWPGGTAPALSTGANDVNIVSLFYDGTNYYATALKDFG